MAPLIVLIGSFLIALLALRLIRKRMDYPLAGRIAMACMLVFTGISHFTFTKGMALMLPDFMPMKTAVIYLTGVIEIMGAIGLLIPGISRISGILLILFFICILPANIIAANNRVNIQAESYDGPGTEYLWFRIPLQMLFIVWIYVFAVRKRAGRFSDSTSR